ncbi:MAG TPA: hypothetical protein VEH83_08585 [Gemmatimonadales bacterium]|nr:hypothetical protein [Gemmatimonadales bacterium]
MSARIEVRSDDLALAGWVAAWLDGMRLSPPVSLAFELRLVREPLVGAEDSRTPFQQPGVEIRSGPPHGDVRITWLAAPARARIAPGALTASVELTEAALADREPLQQSFLAVVLILLLRRAGWHHVHAALARDPRGRDWLFAGDAQSGKSTTAALLATWGWAVGCDDAAFLVRNPSSVEAVAQRAPVALRPAGRALLGLAGGRPARGGRKSAFFPEDLGGTWAARVEPRILVFPRIEGERTSAAPLPAREALAELVRWSAWVVLEPELAQEHLDLLNALARQARCYRVALAPDLFHHRDLLMELVP